MRAEPKALIQRLTKTGTRCLEGAAGKAVSAQHFSVEPEHVLLAILEDAGGDAEPILKHLGIPHGAALVSIERELTLLRGGNPSRPALSEHIFNWIEDAWLLASLTLGEVKVRTGTLLLQALLEPKRYGLELPSPLAGHDFAALKRELLDITSGCPEAAEATPDWEAGGGKSAGASGAVHGGSDSALAKFTHDFTASAREGKIDPIFGRHREIRQVIDILSRRRKNNPIIVGEPGVGKTALVEGLAHAIVAGEVPEELSSVRLVGLDLGALQAGASVKGEFENRLKGVISEVKSSPTPIVLFIDEAHTLIGAGGSQGTSDAANLLKPELARGELKTIAATTWAEYKKYFEKDAALDRRFQPVKVEEPTEEDAIVMLRGLREVYETSHHVTIRDEAVEAAVRLSSRYISGRQLPDKAVDLLDTTAARVRVERNAKPEPLVDLEMEIAARERTIGALRRDLEEGHTELAGRISELESTQEESSSKREVLAERWKKQSALLQSILAARTAVLEAERTSDVDEAELGRLRAEVAEASQSFAAVNPDEALVSVDIDAEAVARTIASWTGIPVGRMRGDSIQAVLRLEDTLRQRIIGQEFAVETVAKTLRISHAKIRDPNAPVGVLLFVGPSGVGKTETAITVAEELYGGEQFMTTINMSEFQEKHTVSRLVGSPPGYVGYGEGGVLTEAVRRRPHSVVLLDECEKADLEVMNLFYQVFDKGTLNDGEGRQIDFRNTVVVLTSNLATDVIMDCFADGQSPSPEEVIDRVRPVLSAHFQPALLARMTIVPFRPIGMQAMEHIAKLKLDKVRRRIQEAHGLEVEFAPELLSQLARQCTAAETGARNVDHILRGSLMPVLARHLLEHMASGEERERVCVKLGDAGEWQVSLE